MSTVRAHHRARWETRPSGACAWRRFAWSWRNRLMASSRRR